MKLINQILREISTYINHILGNKIGDNAMTSSKKKPRDVDIDVIVTKTGDGPCDFAFDIKESDKHKLVFKNDKDGEQRPGYIVYFHIEEPKDVNSQFYSTDSMWVQPFGNVSAEIAGKLGTTVCPTSPCYWDQFFVIGLINKNKTLMIRNKNDYEQDFAFTLRLQVQDCRKVFELDPIGSNQNGGQ